MRHYEQFGENNPYIISTSKPKPMPVHDYRKDFATLMDKACNYLLGFALLGIATLLTYHYAIN